jgi:hypothetical protein
MLANLRRKGFSRRSIEKTLGLTGKVDAVDSLDANQVFEKPEVAWKRVCGSLLSLQSLAEQPQQFIELLLHGDHLLAHVEGNLGPLEIHSHFFDQ